MMFVTDEDVFHLMMACDGGAETPVTNVIRPRTNSLAITNFNNVNATGPVSYTHLDVYKRQGALIMTDRPLKFAQSLIGAWQQL